MAVLEVMICEDIRDADNQILIESTPCIILHPDCDLSIDLNARRGFTSKIIAGSRFELLVYGL